MGAPTLPESVREPTLRLFGVNVAIKYLSLLCLVVQNSSMALTMRYSRTVEGAMYVSSTAVVLSELLKMCASFVLLARENGFSPLRTWTKIREEVLDLPYLAKLSVPAILYTIQNNLQFVAISHLDAATFQVTYQLKIMTTALFSVLMLGKSLDLKKWTSLAILTVGVALVQIPPDYFSPKGQDAEEASEGAGGAFVGLAAVLAACVLSGFAGVYFEKILKGSSVSIWVRNIQLGFYGTLIGLAVVFLQDWEQVREDGFLHGYHPITWAVVINQALGGLLVAVVVKYADNILKGYATSISIIISSIISFLFFAFKLTFLFVLGSSMVMSAVYLYS